MHTVGHHGLSRPFGGSNEPRSEHTPHIDDFRVLYTIFLGDPDSDVKNAKFFRGRPSRPCLCIQLAITDCPGHLEGQTSLKRAYALFRRFSCAIAHHFLGDPDSDVKNAKCFRGRPSRPFLCIWLAITAFPTNLECQAIPEVSIRLISTIFVCYRTPFFG